jgi:methylenetetrahydrofolate dehydrogenase (NADP+)/methenyltetrahydrofolate cyclohydrolase
VLNQVVLNGKELSKKIEQNLKEKVSFLKEKTGKVPMLATIIVGDDSASQTYVKMKVNACERVGIKSLKIELDKSIKTEDLLSVISDLNADENIDGILLQHPVPRHIDERKCFNSIKVDKDVDGVTSANFGAMAMGEESFASATPFGIMLLLDYYKIEIEGKRVVVIGRSPILGKPIAMMLLNKNATVTIAHSKTKDLEKIVKEADVVVACVGKPKFVKSEWLKEGVVIVDAGYNPGNVGDVDLEGAAGVASAYTPVPGGVGPMTIASLLSQTVKSFEKRVNL